MACSVVGRFSRYREDLQSSTGRSDAWALGLCILPSLLLGGVGGGYSSCGEAVASGGNYSGVWGTGPMSGRTCP